uniref:Transmembrane protein 135 N-terminal domain-containing protein n=1 Tax=Anopheles farauti TaxID=69004 RepID=A0A182QKN1_9DIPT
MRRPNSEPGRTMGQLSKHFRRSVAHKTCRDMLHPDQRCPAAWWTFVVEGILGGIRHYLPAVVTPMLFRVHQWHDPEVWRSFLRQYGRCIAAGLPMTGGSFVAFCLFYKCLGQFPPAWFVLVPSLAGGLTAQYLPRHIVRAQGIGLFNMYIEFLIRRAHSPLVACLRTSRLAATVLFAVLSAAIMVARQYLQLERFWFACTYPDDNCHRRHQGTTPGAPSTCRRHVLAQLLRSAHIGLAISLFKNLLPRATLLVTDPVALVKLLVTRFDLGLFGFITGYKTIYEAVNCWLGGAGPSPLVRSGVGGLLAGLAYYCFPNYLLFTFAVTELVELSWLAYMRTDRFVKPDPVRWFDRTVPIAIPLYTASLGLLCHLRIVYPYHINRYWHKLMANGTWGRSDKLAYNYARLVYGSG